MCIIRSSANYKDVTYSHRHSLTNSLKGRLSVSAISPLFVDRYGRSLRLCYLDFYKEAISVSWSSDNSAIGWGFWIPSDFRAPSFCSLCEPCYFNIWMLWYEGQNGRKFVKYLSTQQTNTRYFNFTSVATLIIKISFQLKSVV